MDNSQQEAFLKVLPIAAGKELAFRDNESEERLRGSADFSLSCGLMFRVSKLQLQITSHEPQFLPDAFSESCAG